MLATHDRHGGSQFCIEQANQHDGYTRHDEAERRPEAAAITQPQSGKNDPAPADHRAESQRQSVFETQHATQADSAFIWN